MRRSVAPLFGWFMAGAVVGIFLVVTQAHALGGFGGLLHVGERSALRPAIEAELGSIPLVPGGGHDGQVSYAIGLDLDLSELAEAVGEPGYRHRRILFPVVASLGGVLHGEPLLYGMLTVAVLGLGLAAAAMSDLAETSRTSRWVVAGVLVSPGAWLAVRLLTPDALALGLVLTGLALGVRRRDVFACVVFSAAALTKDQSLVAPVAFAVSLAVQGEFRRALWHAVIPASTLAAWSAIVTVLVGSGFTPRGNLGLPFVGIWESVRSWPAAPLSDVVLDALMILVVGLGIFLAVRLRRSWLGIQIAAWTALAIVSSNWVWEFGNNVARAFAPLVALVALGLGRWIDERRDARGRLTAWA